MPHGALPRSEEKEGNTSPPSPVIEAGQGMLASLDFGQVQGVNHTIAACQQGDEEAFRQLFESHKDKVYSIALRYAGNREAALDIAQDTFLKLMDRIGQFRGDSNFDSWLYRLVVNSCLDYRRREKRLLPMVEDFFASFRAPQESALGDLLRDEM